MPPCIAALDVGTTSVKACLFTPELELIACCVQEYALDTRGAWVEARPETYLAAARDAMCAVLAAAPGHRPEALGLCTQGETMVPADAQGQALRPFLVWLDGRAGAQAAELEKILGRQRFYETTGLPQLSGATPLAKAMWLRENGGLRGAERLLLLEDYLLGWLTGRAVTEPAVQTSTGWYDIRHDRYWPEALEAAGISVRLLPACMPCGEKAGPLRREAAALLGMPEGIPVAAGVLYPALGLLLNPMIAAACMSLSSVCVVSNALRLRLWKPKTKPVSSAANTAAIENIADNDNEEEPTMKKTVTIEGMMCNHCVAHVEKALNALPGVKATVDLAAGTAVVEGAVTDEAIRAAVTDAGYTVKGIQ